MKSESNLLAEGSVKGAPSWAESKKSPVEESKLKVPLSAAGCYIIGTLSLIIGAVMLASAFNSPASLTSDAPIGMALAVVFGSVVWFAMGKVILLLTEIAHNTSKRIN